jgi:hypothetical protein
MESKGPVKWMFDENDWQRKAKKNLRIKQIDSL